MISDASQLAALQTAIALSDGRVRLTKREQELFEKHIEAIRQRILAAAEKRAAAQDGEAA